VDPISQLLPLPQPKTEVRKKIGLVDVDAKKSFRNGKWMVTLASGKKNLKRSTKEE
jgi:hypothetical protein